MGPRSELKKLMTTWVRLIDLWHNGSIAVSYLEGWGGFEHAVHFLLTRTATRGSVWVPLHSPQPQRLMLETTNAVCTENRPWLLKPSYFVGIFSSACSSIRNWFFHQGWKMQMCLHFLSQMQRNVARVRDSLMSYFFCPVPWPSVTRVITGKIYFSIKELAFLMRYGRKDRWDSLLWLKLQLVSYYIKFSLRLIFIL